MCTQKVCSKCKKVESYSQCHRNGCFRLASTYVECEGCKPQNQGRGITRVSRVHFQTAKHVIDDYQLIPGTSKSKGHNFAYDDRVFQEKGYLDKRGGKPPPVTVKDDRKDDEKGEESSSKNPKT